MINAMRLGGLVQALLPANRWAGAIWSCSVAQMLDFPAHTFVRFFDNHGLLTVTQQPQWYTVTGGSAGICEETDCAVSGSHQSELRGAQHTP